jgi:hypothetical protein
MVVFYKHCTGIVVSIKARDFFTSSIGISFVRKTLHHRVSYVVLGFDSRRWLGIFLFSIASRTALRPAQPPIQWVTGALSLGVKRPVREADHSPPSSAEVKE